MSTETTIELLCPI